MCSLLFSMEVTVHKFIENDTVQNPIYMIILYNTYCTCYRYGSDEEDTKQMLVYDGGRGTNTSTL